MPERARVFVAEDNLADLYWIKFHLTKDGHMVVLIARDSEEALEAVGKFKQKGVQAAIIDNEFNGIFIGNILAKTIRNQAPGVKIIGFSSVKLEGWDVDRNLGKNHLWELGRIVSELQVGKLHF